jgi:AraC-like DNA-binding protein
MMKRFSSPRSVDIPAHGLFALESPHSAHFRMEEQAWPFHKLCWIAAGKGSVESGSLSNPVAMGDIFWAPKDVPHRFVDQPDSPMTLVVVCVLPTVFESSTAGRELLETFLNLQRPLQVFRLPKYARERIRDDLRTLLVEQHLRKPGWAASSVAGFLQLMVHLTRVIPQRDKENLRDQFHNTVAHIEENFFRNVRTADLAAMCGVSERTYSGLFRKRMGMTVTAYVRQCRIAYARERLLETENIAYAAYESGFSDLAHFYRVFKKAEGIPPGRFLEQAIQK